MPPKATAAVDSLDAVSVKFILSTIKSCSEFAPDWNVVAKENDIKYGKNARPRFNTIVAKFGFKLEDKKILQIDQESPEKANGTVGIPKKTAGSPKKGKRKQTTTQVSNKKAKIEEEEEDEETEVTEARKESEGEANEGGSGSAGTIYQAFIEASKRA